MEISFFRQNMKQFKQYSLLHAVLLLFSFRFSYENSELKFSGWSGEKQSNKSSYNLFSGEYSYLNRPSNGEKKAVVLSWEPRIILHHNFLTEDECEHLIESAKPTLSRSGVVDGNTGGSAKSMSRTSDGTFLLRYADQTIKQIEDKIAVWTMIPVENGESLQVLRYEKTQKYDAHFDYFFNTEGIKNGGNRMATVLMYLSDIQEGGETVFPQVFKQPYQTPDIFSECAMQGLAVKPYKGLAILFYSIQPNGELDLQSIHGGCPVIQGTKWSATKWIHVGNYVMVPRDMREHHSQVHVGNGIDRDLLPKTCLDRNASCPYWAELGYCTSSKTNMVDAGICLRSCNRCDLNEEN